MFKKKQELANGLFTSNEDLEKHLESILKFELADYDTHYMEIAELKELKEKNSLLFNTIKNLCYKKRFRFTEKPDAYQYIMKSDRFLMRRGSKIPKKTKFSKLGYQVRKLIPPL